MVTDGDILCYTIKVQSQKCISSPSGFCREQQEEDKMERGRWKTGDLVQVESIQQTGWGAERHNHLVLVLRIHNSKYPRATQQHYPLSAHLDKTSRKEDVIYEVLRDDGKYLKLGLKDYAWPGARLTNRLVQSTCTEE